MNVLIAIVIFFMFLIVKNVVNIADRLWIGGNYETPDPDDYCSYGELKDGDTE